VSAQFTFFTGTYTRIIYYTSKAVHVLSLLALLAQTDSIYLLAYSEEAPTAGKKKDALQAKTMMLLRASDRWFSMYLFYLIY